jgi:aromatic ring-cleaving dioxygenase
MARTPAFTVRFTDSDRRKLAQLMEWLGVTQTDALRIAVHKLHAREAREHAPDRAPDNPPDRA